MLNSNLIKQQDINKSSRDIIVQNLVSIKISIIFILFIIILLGLYFYLKIPKGNAIDEDIVEVAHRGGFQGVGVENTIEVIKKAYGKKVKAIEVDLAMTKDKKIIVFHDNSLKRLAQKDNKIENITLAEFKSLKLKQDGFATNGIALDELIKFIKGKKLLIILDLKKTFDDKSFITSLVGDIGKYNLYEQIMVTSSEPILIYKIRRADNRIRGALSTQKYTYENKWLDKFISWSMHSWLPNFLGLSALLIRHDLFSKDQVRIWQQQGIKIFAWTINSMFEKKWLRSFDCGYLTNCIGGDCKSHSGDYPEKRYYY